MWTVGSGEFDGATRHTVPPVDVIEDAYHFYFEIPGLKTESLDARVEDGRLIVAAERKRPRMAAGDPAPGRGAQLRNDSRSVRAAQRREPRQDRGQVPGRCARGDGRKEA